MTKVCSKFSDGSVDVYNGKRDVKVGWQITTPEGHKFEGHSIDEKTARNTALGYAKYGAPFPQVDKPRGRGPVAYHVYLQKRAVELGFKSPAAAYADYAAKLAVRKGQCKVEIVPVQ